MLVLQQQIECPFNYAGDIGKQQHSSHSVKQLSEYSVLEAVRDRAGGGVGRGRSKGERGETARREGEGNVER